MTQKALTSLLIPGGIATLTLALGACQTNPTAMNAPPGMPVALESIEGAPDPVKSELSSALASAAAARKVELVSGTDARYRLRGYLTAYDRQDGSTELAFVWDVFDGDKRRAKRIEGTSFSVTGSAGHAGKTDAGTSDAWTSVDQTVINKVASTSMSEVAGFLATDARSGGQTFVTRAAAVEPAPASGNSATVVASAGDGMQTSGGEGSVGQAASMGQTAAATTALGFSE
ncbi:MULTISPECIES: hypothetical protein [unclassified Chelatococcus]|uniref:hypothetical protein n=1 Tax=unclassified Chelatococcus TaxID=2638111 RepID=UPI001BCED6CF|nr:MULTISPECIES: hypothetical protein [unclassified Chelatococcus]MBS7697759.1 hypothetical protein [Chelatococcus sp. YT9]MBX3558384.1 hypothetical protein [Chelatococcus sp.]